MTTQQRLEKAFRLVYARRLEDAVTWLNECAIDPQYGSTNVTTIAALNTFDTARKAVLSMLLEE